MKKIVQILKERSGSSLILGGFIILCMFATILLIIEKGHLQILDKGVRDALQNAATVTCTENYNKIYNGIREGYSGDYKLTNGSWSEDIDTGDIYSKLDSILGTRSEGDRHVKYDGCKVAYSISDLSVQMTNTPFAPDDPHNEKKFTCIAHATLSVTTGFNWGVPPMQVPITVVAGYSPKF